MDESTATGESPFEQKRREWIDCLSLRNDAGTGLDRNSILAQIYRLIWNASAYRLILEARRIAKRDSEARIMLSGLAHQLLDQCFYESQLVSIRRLMDTYEIGGPMGTFSLTGLIKSMKKNRSLFTRKNFLEAAGYPVDVRAVQEAEAAYCREQERAGLTCYCIPMELDTSRAIEMHEQWDRLCGVSENERTDDDVICESVFDRLEAKLNDAKILCEHANKFVVHAATPESRLNLNADSIRITYGDVWRAHELVCRAFQFIDCFLLRRTNHEFLPTSQPGLLEYMDQPLASADAIPVLEAKWKSLAKESAEWGETSLDWVLGMKPESAS